MGTKTWTPEEDDILRNRYAREKSSCFADIPNHTPKACYRRAMLLGATAKYGRGSWSKKEISILKNYYETDVEKAWRLLPGRSKSACAQMAKRLGLSYGHTRWTKEEQTTLETYYPIEGQAVQNRLPGRSLPSIRQRAARFGISYGVRDENGVTKFRRRRWTVKDEDYLSAHKDDIEQAAKDLDRTVTACAIHLRALGVRPAGKRAGGTNCWRKEDIALLKERYFEEGGSLFKEFGGRYTEGQIRMKISELGIKRGWTAEEDEILREWYPKEKTAVRHRLPRHSLNAIRMRACNFGLTGKKESAV